MPASVGADKADGGAPSASNRPALWGWVGVCIPSPGGILSSNAAGLAQPRWEPRSIPH